MGTGYLHCEHITLKIIWWPGETHSTYFPIYLYIKLIKYCTILIILCNSFC